MNAIKTLTVIGIGLAAVVPAAHADHWRVPAYERGYDDWRAGRRYDDRRVVRREVIVERPVIVHRPPARRVIVERPVYVQPAPVYREHHPYHPRYYESRPTLDAGTVVGAIGGAVVGSMIGSQIEYGQYQGAATVAGAVIGGAIGSHW